MSGTLNKLLLIGRLGKDAERRVTPSGITVTTMSLATDDKKRTLTGWERNTQWHRVVFFDKQAEILAEYAKKGSLLYVEGKVETREFADKSGLKQKITEVIGSKFQFLTGSNSLNETSILNSENQIPVQPEPINKQVSLSSEIPLPNKNIMNGHGSMDELPF